MTMKFGQLIDYSKRNIFLQKHAEIEAGRLVPDPFFFFKKALYKVKASALQLSLNILRYLPQLGILLKQTAKNFIDQETYSILIFKKRVWE